MGLVQQTADKQRYVSEGLTTFISYSTGRWKKALLRFAHFGWRKSFDGSPLSYD